MSLTLAILAAGLSTRYGDLKQLDPVGPHGEVLLDYAIYDARRAGFSRFVLVTRSEIVEPLTEHLRRQFHGSIDATCVTQESRSLPPNRKSGRTKPWGTGHAVLLLEGAVDGPFAVCNADDFYGTPAYHSIADHLRTSTNELAVAGYQLSDTLSSAGGVSRGVCQVDSAGRLEHITEVKDIARHDGRLSGVTVDGVSVDLKGSEVVSTSLWGCTPDLFPRLRVQFDQFLAKHGTDPEAEFLLSNAIDEQIQRGQASVRVYAAPGPWLGITHPEDKAHAVEQIAELVARGDYPTHLWVRTQTQEDIRAIPDPRKKT